MGPLVVSGQELMLLAARLGGTTFYGIRDPFEKLHPGEVHTVIPRLERSLEEKRLASVGFDDSFVVAPWAAELVTACTCCQVYLCAGALYNGAEDTLRRWYRKDGVTVALEQQGSDFVLQKAEPREILNTLCAMTGREESCPAVEEEVVLSYGDFFAAQQEQDLERGRALLVAAGCREASAAVLMDGLHRRGTFCTITATDLVQQRVRGLMAVCSPHGRLRIRQVEGRRGWQVTGMDRETLCGEIGALAAILTGEEGGMTP